MRVSVITPFYKGNRYMPAYLACIEKNVLNLVAGKTEIMTGHDKGPASAGETAPIPPEEVELEAIIVNDSPGETVEIPAGFAGSKETGAAPLTDMIRIYDLPDNSGIHYARAFGLGKSTGDWVLFLDQDDVLADDAILKLAGNAKDDSLDLIISNAVLEQEDDRQLWYRSDYHKKLIWDLKTYLNIGTQIISPGQVLIRREAIPRAWCENILKHNCCDDYYLWLLMLGSGRRSAYVDEPLYIHSRTGENTSADMDETLASSLEMIDALKLSDDLTNAQISLLNRMIRYKDSFRRTNGAGGLPKRLALSLCHPGIFVRNIVFKIRTKTPYGFNR